MSAPTMQRAPATVLPGGKGVLVREPDDIRIGRTHPITPVRFVQMQKVVAEIADKQRRNASFEIDDSQ